VAVESARFKLSRTPARVPEKAIGFGCDNRRVFGEILGFAPDEIAALESAGALV
jgi:hypothetical protein